MVAITVVGILVAFVLLDLIVRRFERPDADR